MSKYLTVLFIALFSLSQASCSDFNKALELQDEYAESFSVTTARVLFLGKTYNPSVLRGGSEHEYSAFLPKGEYMPVASSNGRNFYQAPEGFEYRNGEIIESKIGGIVEVKPNDSTKYYVWFFQKETEYYLIESNGSWIENVKPGLMNAASRPWVEGDLVIEP